MSNTIGKKASAAVSLHRSVKIVGDEVLHTEAGEALFGVAEDSALAGDRINLCVAGKSLVYVVPGGATLDAGSEIKTGASGSLIPLGGSGTAVGRLLDAVPANTSGSYWALIYDKP